MNKEPESFNEGKDLTLNIRNRRRLNTLKRRLSHLEARVAADASLTFDRAEIASLQWAIRIIEHFSKDEHGPKRNSEADRTDTQPPQKRH